MVTAARQLVATLALHGVDRVFCVPGESYIPVLDALIDEPSIHLVTCRHEGGAGLMAVADAKLTGRPGTCFVSRGPGATNASIAVHVAEQDAAPLVLFIGHVERKDIGRGAFQEMDYRRTFADMAKSVEEVQDPDHLPEAAARAYHLAALGTPGPVVVVLPEDMLYATSQAAPIGPRALPRARPAEADLAAVGRALSGAERPVLIAGGQLDGVEARAALLRLSQAWHLPVATSFKRQDLFPNRHANFAGHLGYGIPPQLAEAIAEADLVLAIGTRLGDITTQGYAIPAAGQTLVHVYPDARQIGRVLPASHGIVCDAGAFVAALAIRNAPPAPPGRAAWGQRLHAIYAKLSEYSPQTAPDGVDFGHVAAALQQHLPADAILTNDAGNFSSWMHRYFPFGEGHRLLGAVGGAMGLGVPAAIASALRHPERQVVALCGDGGFLMTGNELATAVKERARIRVIVSNNGGYGTIRLHQEKRFPGRVVGTQLANPDFAALARAFGATGINVKRPEEADFALRQALETPGPVVIDVHSSLDHLSAYTSIGKLRQN
ncbi:MAG: acetolactate synthase [Alphaproteobacteria bacterium]|nr:acetolactate synthase [Alphaproteobacteria bacterium]